MRFKFPWCAERCLAFILFHLIFQISMVCQNRPCLKFISTYVSNFLGVSESAMLKIYFKLRFKFPGRARRLRLAVEGPIISASPRQQVLEESSRLPGKSFLKAYVHWRSLLAEMSLISRRDITHFTCRP